MLISSQERKAAIRANGFSQTKFQLGLVAGCSEKYINTRSIIGPSGNHKQYCVINSGKLGLIEFDKLDQGDDYGKQQQCERR